MLRTVLTALIIALGITALVAILTSIDGIQNSVNDSLSGFGANSFDIKRAGSGSRRNQGGKEEKNYPPIDYRQALRFKDLYKKSNEISISTFITFNAEVKRLSKKTNPNVRIMAGNEFYLLLNGHDLSKGRNFTELEVTNGVNVAIVGNELVSSLFKEGENPINQNVSFLGTKFKIVGVLEEKGGMEGGGGSDRLIVVPLGTGTRLLTFGDPNYTINVQITDPAQMTGAMGDARGLMRSIRKDPIIQEDSFEIEKSESLAETMSEVSGKLRLGGAVISLVTLIGASIALMNIMLVSVTERTREIGVRKALGATPRRIKEQFLIEAIVICCLGGITGVLLGILIGNIVTLTVFKGSFFVPWPWMILAFVVCVIVGLISGFIPANKAAKLDPIESLRFE